jgi:type IV pilus assembly protein PilC
MSQFKYRAVGEDGKVVSGQADALNLPELESRLGRIGLSLIRADALREDHSSLLRRRKVGSRELINFFFHMESLLRAGVPMLEALADLRDSADTMAMRELAGGLRDRIETGSPLSTAMEAYPQTFPKLLVGLVRAGEMAGKLPEVLAEITTSLKWQDEVTAQLKKAITYPAFVAVVITGVVFFLMTYLVPQLVAFIQNMGQELPLHTRALIATSDFILAWWWAIISVPIALLLGIRWLAARNRSVRLWIDRHWLRVPVIGEVIQKILLARFANTFGLMYSSGFTIIDGLISCEEAAGNLEVGDGIRLVRNLITQGVPVSEAFATVGLFPALVLRMIKVGEQTGELDNALKNVSYFYSRDIRESVDRLQTMIEPAMTVVMGLILGWIMLSVLGPIYDTISKIKT